MCDNCDWKDFMSEATAVIELCDDVPERGQEFADSVRDKLTGMRQWARENRHVTDKMGNALDNMRASVERWIHH